MRNLIRNVRARTVINAGLLSAITLGSSLAIADNWRNDANVYYDYAKVTHVEPITRIVQISTPQETCWNERVRTVSTQRGYSQRSFAPTVLGGLLGGVVGNQFGSGSGQKAMTVAGALLGASIGHDASARNHRQRPATVGYTTQRRCEIEQVMHQEQRIEGYNVSYRFRGRDYTTRTDFDPGRQIRVRVEVDPLPAA